MMSSFFGYTQSRKELTHELENKKINKITKWTSKQIDYKVDSLLSLMTLDEKIGQMYEIPSGMGSVADLGSVEDQADPKYYQRKGWTGMVLGGSGALKNYEIQKYAVEKTRLGIPLHFNVDVIHGYKTIFPVNLGMACTWEPAAIERAASIAAKEATVSGITINNAPMVDISRDPRWGRATEGVGEDPFLGSEIARAYVRGYQGDDLSDRHTFISTAKHFVGYGASEAGRDYNTVDMSERVLREIYLPPFKAMVEEGVGAIMPAFNIVDGVPCSANKWLLDDVARGEWGFDGIYLSDFNAIHELVLHGVAADDKHASKIALDATMDIEMVSQGYILNLKNLVKQGEVSETQIDASVKRILRSKFLMGLFDDPYRYMDLKGEKEIHCSKEHLKAAREIATKSMVLLKNDTVQSLGKPLLPLSDNYKSIALIGPFVKTRNLQGAWAWGNSKKVVTVESGFKNRLGDRVELNVFNGLSPRKLTKKDMDEALAAARESEVVVLCLGEPQGMSGEAASRAELDFPGDQKEFAEEVLKLGKPTVLVAFNGRPLIFTWYHEHFSSILEAWFPGTEAGNALADILFGDVNPSGKLTMSFPCHVGQIPVYYNHLATGRPYDSSKKKNRFVSKYLDIPNDPLYSFGYGLSYTSFAYSNLKLSSSKLKAGQKITAELVVSNTGEREGTEIVQMYTHDIVASVARPVKELKGFQKVTLQAGESKKVTFTISEELLKFWNRDMEFSSEAGDFEILIGGSSRDGDLLTEEFLLVK